MEPRETDVHTCHAECPCHEGREPVPDFIEAPKPNAELSWLREDLKRANAQLAQWREERRRA